MKARFVARRREMRRRGARATRATASFARVVARGARRAARGGVRKWSVDSRAREARDGGGGGEEARRALARGDGGARARARRRRGADGARGARVRARGRRARRDAPATRPRASDRDRSLTVTHTRMSEIVVVCMRDARRTRALLTPISKASLPTSRPTVSRARVAHRDARARRDGRRGRRRGRRRTTDARTASDADRRDDGANEGRTTTIRRSRRDHKRALPPGIEREGEAGDA